MFNFKNLKKPTSKSLTALGNAFITVGTALTGYAITVDNITLIIASVVLGGLGKMLCEMYEPKNTKESNSGDTDIK